MRDLEDVYFWRARSMVENDLPHWPPFDQNAAVIDHAYNQQNLKDVFDQYCRTRQLIVDWLVSLPDSAWHRRGVHAEYGEVNLLELVMNVSLHDLNHIEQIARALGLSRELIS